MTDNNKPTDDSIEQPETNEMDDASVDANDATGGDNGTAPEDALAKAQDEVAKLKEDMLRTQAEMQNVRRRADLDVEKAHKFGVEKFANEMISVVDNLERALAASPEDDATKALREGVEMTYQGFITSLAKFGVSVVNPEQEPFNPEHHQAMSMVENHDVAPNTVIAVMQKGYLLNERLLRPAMVMVSKGAPSIDENA